MLLGILCVGASNKELSSSQVPYRLLQDSRIIAVQGNECYNPVFPLNP